jgi:hypothetical protein
MQVGCLPNCLIGLSKKDNKTIGQYVRIVLGIIFYVDNLNLQHCQMARVINAIKLLNNLIIDIGQFHINRHSSWEDFQMEIHYHSFKAINNIGALYTDVFKIWKLTYINHDIISGNLDLSKAIYLSSFKLPFYVDQLTNINYTLSEIRLFTYGSNLETNSIDSNNDNTNNSNNFNNINFNSNNDLNNTTTNNINSNFLNNNTTTTNNFNSNANFDFIQSNINDNYNNNINIDINDINNTIEYRSPILHRINSNIVRIYLPIANNYHNDIMYYKNILSPLININDNLNIDLESTSASSNGYIEDLSDNDSI